MRLGFQFDISGRGAREQGDPRLEFGAREIGEPLVVGPWQPIGPKPIAANGGIQEAVEFGTRNSRLLQLNVVWLTGGRMQLGRF